MKTPNGKVDKRDRGLNLAPPIHQFWAQTPSATGRSSKIGSIEHSSELALMVKEIFREIRMMYSSN